MSPKQVRFVLKGKLQNLTSGPQWTPQHSLYSCYISIIASTCNLAAAFSSPALHSGSHRACTHWWLAVRSWIVPCSPYTLWLRRSATLNALWTLWRRSASNTTNPEWIHIAAAKIRHKAHARSKLSASKPTFVQVAHTHCEVHLWIPGTIVTRHAGWWRSQSLRLFISWRYLCREISIDLGLIALGAELCFHFVFI